MASRTDVFTFRNGQMILGHSHHSAPFIIDSVCDHIEKNDDYEPADAPMADVWTEAAALIDYGQKKAWIWQGALEEAYWRAQGEQKNGSIVLKRHDFVPRLWTFIIVPTYRHIYQILKDCNQWPWPEPTRK